MQPACLDLTWSKSHTNPSGSWWQCQGRRRCPTCSWRRSSACWDRRWRRRWPRAEWWGWQSTEPAWTGPSRTCNTTQWTSRNWGLLQSGQETHKLLRPDTTLHVWHINYSWMHVLFSFKSGRDRALKNGKFIIIECLSFFFPVMTWRKRTQIANASYLNVWSFFC